jgi:hypothetical protein
VAFSVNGESISWDTGWPYGPHWMAIDVSGRVAAGSNQLALLPPHGFLGYRVYLSGESPKSYPFLGKEANSRWVDFTDWRTACRGDRVRRGVEAIRQVDPDRPIAIDAPHEILDEARESAAEMGGVLHDTGGMAGSWNIYEVLLSHAAGLPYSLEPGNGPRSAEEYRTFLGRYMTEGVQSVESVCPAMEKVYFDERVRKCAEENVPLTQLIGKYHVPPAKVACFISNREMERLAYPWKPDASKVLSMGYHGWCCGLEYPAAAVMESDFLKDRAGQFVVVIDGNTQIMDDRTVDGIERYVKEGGVFVTLGQTGRHTETEADRWPISRLTGYEVMAVDPHAPDGGECPHPGGLDDPIPDNGIFQVKRWRDSKLGIDNLPYANGLSLKKIAPECRDLIRWKDGTTAVGIRPLGRGYVVNMAVVFGRYGSGLLMQELLEDIVRWRGGAQRTPGQIYPAVIADSASLPSHAAAAPGARYLLSAVEAACRNAYPHDLRGFPWAYQDVLFRHYRSNNGLYDVWVLHNQSPNESRTVDLTFRDGLSPPLAIDVRANRKTVVDGRDGVPKIHGIRMQPLETRAFLTPHTDILRAALEWFELQRNWWRSSDKPTRPLPPVPHRFTIDRFEGWAFKPLDGQTDAQIAALAGPGTDDAGWERRPLGIWTTPRKQSVRHGLLRRWVDIPRTWDRGSVRLWLSAWYMGTFYDRGTLYLDGEKCATFSPFYG